MPETFGRAQPVWRQFVEHDKHAERTSFIDFAQVDIIGLAARYEPDQTRIMYDNGMGPQVVSADAEISRRVWSSDEREHRWIDLWGPEDRLDKRRVARVRGEIATPNRRQIPGQLLPLAVQRPPTPHRPFCNWDCDARTPKQDHPGSAYRYSRKRFQTANFHPRTFDTASAQHFTTRVMQRIRFPVEWSGGRTKWPQRDAVCASPQCRRPCRS